MIQGISMQLPERFKIKIGGKGQERQGKRGAFRLPVKWPFMKICRNERDEDGNFIIDEDLTESMGSEIFEWKDSSGKVCASGPRVIGPIALLYNDPDLNMFTAYRCYAGRTCACRGNGVTAKQLNDNGEWAEVQCPCKKLTGKNPTCKPNGIFSFLFPDAPLQGVAKFRTTSYNSIRSIAGGMELVRSLTRGRLIGIPFFLRLNETQAQVQGKVQTIYYLSLECNDTMSGIWGKMIEYTKNEAAHLVEIEYAETEARKQIAMDADIIVDADGDPDVDEYYPQYEETESGAIVDKATGELVESAPVETKEPKFPLKQKKAPDPEPDPEPEPEPEEDESPSEPIDIGKGGFI